MFREIRQANLSKYYNRNMDLFYFFFHLAIDLGRTFANINFITTNYYTTATGAKILRQDFKNRTIIKQLINLNELKIFESAQGQHNMITFLQKGHDTSTKAKTCVTKHKGFASSKILENILSWKDKKTKYFEIKQKDLYESEELYIRLTLNEITKILNKVAVQSKSLDNFCDVFEGIQTGANTIFIYNGLPNFHSQLKEEESSLIVPFYKNSDITRYCYAKNTKYLLYFPNKINIEKFPNIQKYLNGHKEKLSNRAHIKRSNQKWYTLLWPRDPKLFLPGPKIVSSYRPKTNSFCYTENQFYSGTDTYFVVNPKEYSLKFIVGFLNSKLSLLWLKNKGKIKGNIIDMTGDTIEQIMIPNKELISNENKNKIEFFVDNILAITKTDDYLQNSDKQVEVKKLEEKINQLIYKIYHLTSKEVEILENASSHNI